MIRLEASNCLLGSVCSMPLPYVILTVIYTLLRNVVGKALLKMFTLGIHNL